MLVGNYAYGFNGMLNIFPGSMYSGIFNPMSALPLTAPKQMNCMTASASGSIMKYSSIGESGIVMPAQKHFHKRRYFKSISEREILS